MISKINPSTSLPSEWKLVKLKEVCKTSSGGTPSRKNEQYFNGDIPWLKSGELNYNIVRYSEEKITKEAIENSSAKIFPKGTLLVALYGATVGRLGVLGIDAATNQAISAIFTHKLLFQKHLYWFLFSYRKKLLKDRIGGAQPNISQTILNDISLPFPPLNEQHQIVAKIEELFSELDNGIENLKKVQKQLKTYRQAVLKYAFEGKLTKEWRTLQMREGNPPEPAEKLLEQIKAKREKHYQEQLEDWKRACEQAKTEGNKKPARPRKPKELPPLTEKELAELPELPQGWGWFKLLQICDEITDGDHQPPPKSPSGIPFITISNIQNNQIDFSNTFFVNENYYSNLKDSRRPQIGDILYTVTGSYGIPVLINFEQKFCFQRHIGLIRPYKKILNRYAFYLLQSNQVYQQAKKVATGTAQKTVSLEGLRNFKSPVSSIPEQSAIVSEIESRLSVCDKIEQTVEDSLKKAEALRQSILKKAFAGELTRDWREKHPELITGENSAEKLLEKIKAEKALSIASRKKPRSKKAKKK